MFSVFLYALPLTSVFTHIYYVSIPISGYIVTATINVFLLEHIVTQI